MMVASRGCKICTSLPFDVLKQVDRLLLSDVGVDEIVQWVTSLGHGGSLTNRSYYDHKRHAKHEVLITTDRTTLEVSKVHKSIDTVWTASETLEALYTAKVEQVNRLKTQCEKLPSLRAEEQLARSVIELEAMVVNRADRLQAEKRTKSTTDYVERNSLCRESGLLPACHERLEKDFRLDGLAVVPTDKESYLYNSVPTEKLLELLKDVYQQK